MSKDKKWVDELDYYVPEGKVLAQNVVWQALQHEGVVILKP